MNAREITDELKALGLKLAREHAVDPEMLGACHLGLGIVMLRELHYPLDDLIRLVKSVAAEHVPN